MNIFLCAHQLRGGLTVLCSSARACLALWNSIKQVKLTAGGSAGRVFPDEHLNPLTCVPAQCSSLIVDEHFAPFIGHIAEPAKLQHLAIKYWDSCTYSCGKSPHHVLFDLRHMRRLRALKVESFGQCSNPLDAKWPDPLMDVYIGGSNEDFAPVRVPCPGQQQHTHLRRLTKLELHLCSVHIPEDSIACLTGLTA